MSTSEEIQEVFEQEIADKTRLVYSKLGQTPFYNNFQGFQTFDLYDHLGIDKVKCSEFYPREKKCRSKKAVPTK